MLRILFLFHGDPGTYGGAKSGINLLKVLNEYKDISIIAITPFNCQVNKVLNTLNIENYALSYYHNIYELSRPLLWNFKHIYNGLKQYTHIYDDVLKILGNRRVDIVHSNSSVIWVGAYLAKRLNAKHIWHIRELEIDWKYYLPFPYILMNNYTDKFVAISDAVTRCWEKRGLESKKIIRINNGFDLSARINNIHKNHDAITKFVFVGRICKEKGQVNFLQLLNRANFVKSERICIHFYGDGSARDVDELTHCIKQVSNFEAKYLGYFDNVESALTNYDIGVVNSIGEAFGRVTIEYLLAGLYVLATTGGANPEIVTDPRLGLLYKYGNLASMEHSLTELLKVREVIDEGERREFIDRHLQKFSDANSAAQICNLYKSVTNYKG